MTLVRICTRVQFCKLYLKYYFIYEIVSANSRISVNFAHILKKQ
jgi:hypothetical protein